MTDPLTKLFGSAARVKLLRLFLFNPRATYTAPDAANRARVPERTARAELALFKSAGVIKRARGRSAGARWGLAADFTHRAALQGLLLNVPERAADIVARLRGAGAVRLIVLAGMFVDEWEGRLDLLLVGDRINERKLRTRMRTIESELGKELRYTLLSTPDFLYRYNMNDKLVRDVFDYAHAVAYDRLNIGLK